MQIGIHEKKFFFLNWLCFHNAQNIVRYMEKTGLEIGTIQETKELNFGF